MIAELATRFAIGGLVVSLFAVAGEMFQPKTFAGLFGAAPSVAIATLTLAYVHEGRAYVAISARSMLIGCVALLVYSAACVATTKRVGMPVWLGAGLGWVAWAAIGFASWAAATATGVLP
jgi:hypothetical protein